MTPYKFQPVLKTPLWGGRDIVQLKGLSSPELVGESWEISGVPGDESLVAEGPDRGMTLARLIERDGEKLIGRRNFERFGTDFPLLIKFISADQALSIQVHPDDAMAQRVEGKPFGKTEMWYVVGTHEGAELFSGFNRDLSPEAYDQLMAEGRLTEALAHYNTRPGDCFFLPAGQIHSIGAGNFIVEIQQSSDLTYRVYDFDRVDASGQKRPLHTEQARQALNFTSRPDYRTHYTPRDNARVVLESHPEFTTSLYRCTQPVETDFSDIDSFVIFVAFEGAARLIDSEGNTSTLRAGESILFPATNRSVRIEPYGCERFSCIETYVF